LKITVPPGIGITQGAIFAWYTLNNADAVL